MDPSAGDLFRHVSADKATLYRAIMDVFAAAKRQYRLQLRPDEVLSEGKWNGATPTLEELGAALSQLTAWGNLESQPDTTRVSSLADFYRARFLYRLSRAGEAVEAAIEVFIETMDRRAALQTVALEDIVSRLEALRILSSAPTIDAAKIHETLRDLVTVFEGLTDNAQAFMAGIARSLELHHAKTEAVVHYKHRVIDYLERFMAGLIARLGTIARIVQDMDPQIEALLEMTADREACDAAPGSPDAEESERTRRLAVWRERWRGLRGWFLSTNGAPPQAELLRSRARAAIPQLLAVINALNERRSGRSDRSADFRILATWFADCVDDAGAHRLARAAFALHSARHYAVGVDVDQAVLATTSWVDAPPLRIHPRLRELGEATPRGPLARMKDRTEDRDRLAQLFGEDEQRIEAAQQRLATGRPVRLSQLGRLDSRTFQLFLSLVGDAIGGQENPDEPVARNTGDGLLHIHLEPLGPETRAQVETDDGVFAGRDHVLTVRRSSDQA